MKDVCRVISILLSVFPNCNVFSCNLDLVFTLGGYLPDHDGNNCDIHVLNIVIICVYCVSTFISLWYMYILQAHIIFICRFDSVMENLFYVLKIIETMLLLLSGDVHPNPGPNLYNTNNDITMVT